MAAEKPKFVAYLRVSTARQGRSGLGLEAQQEAVRHFVRGQAGEIIAPEYTEVESGKAADNRPQLTRAINRCRKTGATLVVAKLDRLSRNAAFLMTLRDSGVQFVAADLPQANTMTVGVMAIVAQHEREAISQRTKDALAATRARGTVLGGFRENAPDIRLVQKTGVRATVKAAGDRAEFIRDEVEPLYHAGKSLRAIAKALNEAGILTPQSQVLNEIKKLTPENKKVWGAQGVANVVLRLGLKPAHEA